MQRVERSQRWALSLADLVLLLIGFMALQIVNQKPESQSGEDKQGYSIIAEQQFHFTDVFVQDEAMIHADGVRLLERFLAQSVTGSGGRDQVAGGANNEGIAPQDNALDNIQADTKGTEGIGMAGKRVRFIINEVAQNNSQRLGEWELAAARLAAAARFGAARGWAKEAIIVEAPQYFSHNGQASQATDSGGDVPDTDIINAIGTNASADEGGGDGRSLSGTIPDKSAHIIIRVEKKEGV